MSMGTARVVLTGDHVEALLCGALQLAAGDIGHGLQPRRAGALPRAQRPGRKGPRKRSALHVLAVALGAACCSAQSINSQRTSRCRIYLAHSATSVGAHAPEAAAGAVPPTARFPTAKRCAAVVAQEHEQRQRRLRRLA